MEETVRGPCSAGRSSWRPEARANPGPSPRVDEHRRGRSAAQPGAANHGGGDVWGGGASLAWAWSASGGPCSSRGFADRGGGGGLRNGRGELAGGGAASRGLAGCRLAARQGGKFPGATEPRLHRHTDWLSRGAGRRGHLVTAAAGSCHVPACLQGPPPCPNSCCPSAAPFAH